MEGKQPMEGKTRRHSSKACDYEEEALNWGQRNKGEFSMLRFTGKDSDAGKDSGQEEKGATEDEMVGWHHQLNRHEFEQTPGDSKG